MSTPMQDMLAFHLTGKRDGEAPDGGVPTWRPALLAPYARLTALRYDFPLILLDGPDPHAYVDTLSGVVNRLLREIASDGGAGTLLRQHVLRLETRMRERVADGATLSLGDLWEQAAASLLAECGEREAELLGNSLATARFALRVDGRVLDCDERLPSRLLRHTWEKVEARRSRATLDRIEALIIRLREMLKVDDLKRRESRSPQKLRQTFGRRYREAFDFELMADILEGATPGNALPADRRNRIRDALAVLESQRFFVPFGGPRDARYHDFVFDSLSAALKAWDERLHEVADVIRAIEVADLEIDNAFREDRHGAYFRRFGPQALSLDDLAMFPAYLVCLNADDCTTRDTARLMQVVSRELPMNVLIQVGDALGAPSSTGAGPNDGTYLQQLTHTFVAGNACVVQAPASNLVQQRDAVLHGLEFDGPSIFGVYVPAAGDSARLPPYLSAAAAMEARVFPAFSYDPAAGKGLADRFDVGSNPDVGEAWPCRALRYEDEALQTIVEDYRYTPADFVVTDVRYDGHFEAVAREDWTDDMLPVAEYLALDDLRPVDKVPYVAVIDPENRLHRMVVDDALVRLVRRYRDRWQTLQELGGVHNSWAEAAEARMQQAAVSPAPESAATARLGEPDPPQPGEDAAAPDAGAEPGSGTVDAGTDASDGVDIATAPDAAADEPWVETPRCTTCDECTTRNPRMFAYDDNKQAYIRDPDAGPFRDLVEAAEICQVAIIHPGKPRNPDEPGLPELIERAAPFNA